MTAQMVDAALFQRVNVAEAAVRAGVPNFQLTQQQFDSLVSFVYNVGAQGATVTLAGADGGNMGSVASHIQANVYVHPRDSQGRRLPAVRVQGLVNRRQRESAPFLHATQVYR